MIPLLRKRLGLGAVLTLLAGPALAQACDYSGHYGAPGYGAPFHDQFWQHERHEAMWRADQRHEAWAHANHGYVHGDDHGFGGNADRGGY